MNLRLFERPSFAFPIFPWIPSRLQLIFGYLGSLAASFNRDNLYEAAGEKSLLCILVGAMCKTASRRCDPRPRSIEGVWPSVGGLWSTDRRLLVQSTGPIVTLANEGATLRRASSPQLTYETAVPLGA